MAVPFPRKKGESTMAGDDRDTSTMEAGGGTEPHGGRTLLPGMIGYERESHVTFSVGTL